MLEPDWITGHRNEFDLVHLHFGFDAVKPVELQRWIDELDRNRRPLVLTVHDLVNPHFVDQRQHREQLDVLVEAAAALITLTPGAAAAICERWGRTAEVIPHPHVVPLSRIPSADDRREADLTAGGRELVIGVHAKNLRANLDPLPVLTALDVAVRRLPDTVVRVDLHPDVLQRKDSAATDLARWLRGRRGDPGWRIEVHPRYPDDDLWRYLAGLDLCVLPYRFGTHSGWLEACVDVGTGVVVPKAGFYAEQHGHPSYSRAASGEVDQDNFSEVIRRIHDDRTLARPPRPDRRRQRRLIAAAHETIYRKTLNQPH
jgi:hypothetical protein